VAKLKAKAEALRPGDPTDKATPLQAVPLLVRSRGAEVGARTQFVKGLDSTLAFFLLHTMLWLFRLMRTRRHWREHKESDKGEVYYKRFARFQRWQHAVMIVTFWRTTSSIHWRISSDVSSPFSTLRRCS